MKSKKEHLTIYVLAMQELTDNIESEHFLYDAGVFATVNDIKIAVETLDQYLRSML